MFKFITLLVSLLFSFNVLQAAPASKTPPPVNLMADMAIVFNGYWKVKEAQDKFAEKEEKARVELQDLFDKGVALEKEVQALRDSASNPALTEDARKKFEKESKEKEEDLRQKSLHFNQYQQSINRTLTQEQENVMKTFADDVHAVAEIIRQEKGASAVFNIAGPMVIAFDSKNDITQLILDRLNANKPKSADTGATATSAAESNTAGQK